MQLLADRAVGEVGHEGRDSTDGQGEENVWTEEWTDMYGTGREPAEEDRPLVALETLVHDTSPDDATEEDTRGAEGRELKEGRVKKEGDEIVELEPSDTDRPQGFPLALGLPIASPVRSEYPPDARTVE